MAPLFALGKFVGAMVRGIVKSPLPFFIIPLGLSYAVFNYLFAGHDDTGLRRVKDENGLSRIISTARPNPNAARRPYSAVIGSNTVKWQVTVYDANYSADLKAMRLKPGTTVCVASLKEVIVKDIFPTIESGIHTFRTMEAKETVGEIIAGGKTLGFVSAEALTPAKDVKGCQ